MKPNNALMRSKNSRSRRAVSLCRCVWPWLGSLVVLVFCGCAGYQVGPTNGRKPGESSVAIVPFQNQTLEPRVGDAVTAAMRKQLQRDGTYRLATGGESDIVVTGTVTKYYRQALSLDPNDVATARDYQVWVIVQVTARERAGGKLLLDQPVTAKTFIRVGSDLHSTERQTMPLLAEDVAKSAIALLVDGAW